MSQSIKEKALKMLKKHRQYGCQEVDCDICEEREIEILKLFDFYLKGNMKEVRKKIKEYAGKVFGFEIVITDDNQSKDFIDGFEKGKVFMKEECFRIIDDILSSLK